MAGLLQEELSQEDVLHGGFKGTLQGFAAGIGSGQQERQGGPSRQRTEHERPREEGGEVLGGWVGKALLWLVSNRYIWGLQYMEVFCICWAPGSHWKLSGRCF